MKIFTRKHLILGIVSGCVLVLTIFLFIGNDKNDLAPSVTNTTDLNDEQEQIQIGLPVHIKIPRISVDAEIEHVGLTSEGAMDVPRDKDHVAWYLPGPQPGEIGSAVIAGHLDWYNGETAVFENLAELSKGDQIEVEDENGNTVTFVVRESRIYDADAYAPEVFVSDDGTHLNLVTCVGTWDKSKNSYTKRLVVFADIVN